MSQPAKRSKSGVYYFRRGVPAALKERIGKSEWKTSLGTKDLAEAKSLHLAEATRCEAAFESARRGETPGATILSTKQIAALGGAWFSRKLDARTKGHKGESERLR